MKLIKCERKDYKNLKEQLKPLFFVNKALGLTVAVYQRPGQQYTRVTTAYCGKKDKFNQKRGKYTALLKLTGDGGMLVPIERLEAVLDTLLTFHPLGASERR
jgi:hypothetical protein